MTRQFSFQVHNKSVQMLDGRRGRTNHGQKQGNETGIKTCAKACKFVTNNQKQQGMTTISSLQETGPAARGKFSCVEGARYCASTIDENVIIQLKEQQPRGSGEAKDSYTNCA